MSPLKMTLIKLHASPNTVTYAGFFVSVVISIILYESKNSNALLLLIPVLSFAKLALNALDGMLAEAYGSATKFGGVLNEFFDRLSDTAIFVGLSLMEGVKTELGLIAALTVLLTSYTGIVGKAFGGSRKHSGIMGKTERMAFLATTALIVYFTKMPDLWNYLLYFIIAGCTITIGLRFYAIRRELSK